MFYISFYKWIVHITDTAEVMQRERNSIDHRLKSERLFDQIPVICESSLARKLAWKRKVNKAVKGEEDRFWTEVAMWYRVTNTTAFIPFYILHR